MPIQKIIDKFIAPLIRHKKLLFFLLTFISGIITIWPSHDFQYFLSPGDHGRELYCYKKAMDGAIAYRDFSWLYGPFLLYYFGIFFHFFGTAIQSVLLGHNLLLLTAGIVMYLICAVFMSPTLAYISALWFWAFRGLGFFYSYHHIGGILFILIIFYFLIRYIHQLKPIDLYLGFLSVFILVLIRPNMGLAILVAYAALLMLANGVNKEASIKKKIFLPIQLSAIIITVSSIIYWYFLHPLPHYAITQTFPYTQSQLAAAQTTKLEALRMGWGTIWTTFTATWKRTLLGLTLICSILQCIFLVRFGKLSDRLKSELILIFTSLSVFFIFSLHEFIASGVPFRLNWAVPIFIIMMFYLMHCFVALGPKKIFTPTVNFLIFLILFYAGIHQIKNNNTYINSLKTPERLLHAGQTKIYTSQDPAWIQTVTDAVNFIKTNVPGNEKVLALPHDALYYFLSGRDGATRQLAFFEHTHIPLEQELKTIEDLKKNNVNWIVLSNRIRSVEYGMGIFGKTHCPTLAKYISEHYKTEAQFGDWVNPGGWAWNHGVRILRKVP